MPQSIGPPISGRISRWTSPVTGARTFRRQHRLSVRTISSSIPASNCRKLAVLELVNVVSADLYAERHMRSDDLPAAFGSRPRLALTADLIGTHRTIFRVRDPKIAS